MKKELFAIVLILLCVPRLVLAVSGGDYATTVSANVIGNNNVLFTGGVYTSSEKADLSFEYGTTPSFGLQSKGVSVKAGKPDLKKITVFFLNNELKNGAKYYYRAVLDTPVGSIYGETKSFDLGSLSNTSNSAGSGQSNGGVENSAKGGTTSSGSSSGGQENAAATGLFTGNNSNNGVQENGSGNLAGTKTITEGPARFFQTLFDSVTGARPLSLNVSTTPLKPTERNIVEYKITYANSSKNNVGEGELTMFIPESVVYLGDNTGGKTTLSSVSGGQQLTMKTVALTSGQTKTVSIIGVATSMVGKISPLATARMSYLNKDGVRQEVGTGNKGTVQVATVAQTLNTKADTVSSASDAQGSSSILPSSIGDWLIFLVAVTVVIMIVRRVTAMYQERKKKILEEEVISNPHAKTA